MVGLLAGAVKGLLKKPQKINPDKFAGKMEATKAAAKPKGAIVPSQQDSVSIVKVVDIKPKDPKVKAKGGPLAEIQESVHSIVVALKGEQDAKKKRAVVQQKKNQKKKRLNLEALSEVGKVASGVAGGIASATGITSLWDSIWKTVGLLFAGWLTQYLPQIIDFIKKFGSIAGNIINVAKPIVKAVWDTMVWVTDKGVKLVALLTGVKPDEASENSIIKNLTEIQKRFPLIEAAFGFFALLKLKTAFGSDRLPPKPKGKKPKWRKNLEKKFKKSKFGKTARNMVARFKKLKRTLSPKRIINSLKRGGGDKLLKRITTNVSKIKPAKTIQNLTKKIQPGKTLQNLTKNIKPGKTFQNLTKNFFSKKAGPSLFSRALSGTKNIAGKGWQLTKNVAGKSWNYSKSIGKQALKGLNTFAKSQMKNLNKVIKGIRAQGAKWAQQIGGALDNMNPMKLGEKVKKLLKGPIDDILKKNKTVSKLLKIKPKTAIKAIGKLMETTQKSGSLKTLMKGLEKAKAAKIGGVDKVIAAIMGVINYAALGESPINAILQAVGGLLGYTAGFAIGAPFGGAPGFITGMAGAWVGENAAKLLAKGLAQTELVNTPDPIADALGIAPRMMVRDPDNAAMNEEVQSDESSDELSGTETKSKDADLISESASYDQNGKETLIPVPIEQMKSNTTIVNTSTASGGDVNKYETVDDLKKTMVLSKMYSA